MTPNEHESLPPLVEAVQPVDPDLVLPVASVVPVGAEGVKVPAVSGPPHPNFLWSVLWCLGFLMATQVPGSIVAAVLLVGYALTRPGGDAALAKAAQGDAELMSWVLAPALVVTELLVIGVSWLVLRLVVGREWRRHVGVRRPALAHAALAVAALVPLLVLADSFYVQAKEHLPSMNDLIRLIPGMGKIDLPNLEETMKTLALWPWWFSVLVIGVGPGVGEELWCRGFLGRGLVGRYGVLVGVLLSSFFFGLIHLDPAQGSMAALMGIALHFMYLTSRSLWVPILFHFLNNSLSMLSISKDLEGTPFLSPLRWLEEAQKNQPLGWMVPGAAFLVVGSVAWAMYHSRARLEAGAAAPWPVWSPKHPGVEHPPEGSGTTVAYPSPSWRSWALVAGSLAVFAGVVAALR